MRTFPVLLLRNCHPADDTLYFLELTGKTLDAMHAEVGEFIMKALYAWSDWKVKTGLESHVHIEPTKLTRAQINKLEVEKLLSDPRTYSRGT